MKTTTPRGTSPFLSLAVILVMAAIAPAAILQDKSPLAGKWNANLSKSKRHPNHLFKSATLRFTISGDVVTLSYSGVNMSGVEEKGTTTFHPDGKEHPLEGLPGAVEVSRWVGARILETVARQDGKVIGQSTFEVSSDGKALTANLKGTDASGAWFEQVIVCDRE
ncbi:MAG TPA: hypothetical protein VI837_01200 [Blastocatellia bacterium]|nr:hypothetical protein [Blastocatellia bacterium]